MPTPRKAAIIAETREELEQAAAAVLADYRGMTVQQMTQLRRTLAQQGVTLRVIKNTLLRLAAEGAGIEGLDAYLAGPTAVAFSRQDPVAPAKALNQAIRDYRRMEIKGGVLGRSAIGPDQVRALAELPPREVLVGQLVSALASPMQRVVWVFNAPLANLARVLDQIRQQREAAG
ncbi:MAG: 50S ribosomal protein L10 [Firmicutes bacterium]|nr:50S ribosomal protein L10 [Alicyclobacillaceae bacterium]MCL6497953.1 50S ribosomal protein L10 [Bacillota bacterium]